MGRYLPEMCSCQEIEVLVPEELHYIGTDLLHGTESSMRRDYYWDFKFAGNFP
jgi:hypothetical protein